VTDKTSNWDEKGDLLAYSHNVLNRQKKKKNCFCQPLNIHDVNDARQSEIHATEPFVRKSSPFEFETAIAKLTRCDSK
jgi:hypothetical protein